ncbi:response regulator [Chelativorans salis]|uniref:Response regulator n=1 Tax=Chelativorans salis TaxID=2978478 RepID=A0ABT2LUT6_9HYPH|nr:response regulator [Chelativorans sp. EGI FJ00035]MCT7378293.1 response regulator [Chelativorans sp. EGI FJ00035]
MERRRESLTGLRILVAEDETFVLMDIEDMLRDLQCEIVGTVATVEAAVEAIRENPVDGALLDLNLHGQTILPAAEELVRRAVPFLLVTGYASRNGDVPVLRDAPRLKKPFSLGGLRAAMHEVFIQRSA